MRSPGVFLLLVVLWCSRAAHAIDLNGTYTWKQVPTRGGGWITGGVVHPGVKDLVYMRSDVGGAYRWNSSSRSWKQLLVYDNISPTSSISSGHYAVEALAVSAASPNILLLAVGSASSLSSTTGSYILRSTNRGESFTAISAPWAIAGNNAYRFSERMAIDPFNASIVYYGTRNKGVMRSFDGGYTWSQLSTTLVPAANDGATSADSAGITNIVMDSWGGRASNGRCAIIWVTQNANGVYRSLDGGVTFTNLAGGSGPGTDFLARDARVDGNGTFYMAGAGVWRYKNSTKTWKNIIPSAASTSTFYEVIVNPFNLKNLFLFDGYGYKFYRTTDGGSSWTKCSWSKSSNGVGWIDDTTSYEIAMGGWYADPWYENRYWVGAGFGVFNVRQTGSSKYSFDFNSTGIEETVTYAVVAPGGTHNWTYTMRADIVGMRHTDLVDPPSSLLVDPLSVALGTDITYQYNDPLFMVLLAKNVLYSGAGPRRDYSSWTADGGVTWHNFTGRISKNGSESDWQGWGNIAVAASDKDNLVWAPAPSSTSGTNNAYVYYSRSRGANWTKAASVVATKNNAWYSQKFLTADTVLDNTFYVYQGNGYGRLWKSTDGGATWSYKTGLPTSAVASKGQLVAMPGVAEELWWSSGATASSVGSGLYRSTDAGSTWTKVKGRSYLTSCFSFGFGKALPSMSSTYRATVFAFGRMNKTVTYAMWRSTNYGSTWDRISDNYPLGIYDGVKVVNGDMGVFGRVYIGFSGNGFAYGEPTTTTSTSTTVSSMSSASSFTDAPTTSPSQTPSNMPSQAPSVIPSSAPSNVPSPAPSDIPSASGDAPSRAPSQVPSQAPSTIPSTAPTTVPSHAPSRTPTHAPSDIPSQAPSSMPSKAPTTLQPTGRPSPVPTSLPTVTQDVALVLQISVDVNLGGSIQQQAEVVAAIEDFLDEAVTNATSSSKRRQLLWQAPRQTAPSTTRRVLTSSSACSSSGAANTTTITLTAGFSNSTAIQHLLTLILSQDISLSTATGDSVATLLCSYTVTTATTAVKVPTPAPTSIAIESTSILSGKAGKGLGSLLPVIMVAAGLFCLAGILFAARAMFLRGQRPLKIDPTSTSTKHALVATASPRMGE